MRRGRNLVPLAAIFLGVGILAACFFPAQWLVVLVALAIVVIGVLSLHC